MTSERPSSPAACDSPGRRNTLVALASLAGAGLLLPPGSSHAQHAGHAHPARRTQLGCSAAFDAHGQLWIASREAQGEQSWVVLQAVEGTRTGAPVRVHADAENVEAGGESRPKLAFGPGGTVHVAWSRLVARPHVCDIRYARSTDGGRHFGPPRTVQSNRDAVTHSFESLALDREGRVYLAWIDGRDAKRARDRRLPYAGSAIYTSVSQDGGQSFAADSKLADHCCECCRLSLAQDAQGRVVAFWRHVFAPNVRDHALALLDPQGKATHMERATFDDWRVDACPHHGPAHAFDASGARHQVWFNGRDDEGGGVQYAVVRGGGKPQAVRIGTAAAQHADIVVTGTLCAIAWKQFDGKATSLVLRTSTDGGQRWVEKTVAQTQGDSDKPRLAAAPGRAALVWHTQDEGMQVFAVEGKA